MNQRVHGLVLNSHVILERALAAESVGFEYRNVMRPRGVSLGEEAVELKIVEGNGLDQGKKSREIAGIEIVGPRQSWLQQKRDFRTTMLPGNVHQPTIANELDVL